MASITKRPDGRWRARYRDAAGKEHAKHFARKLDGQRWLDEVTSSVVTGNYTDPKTARTTVGEWCDDMAGRVRHPPRRRQSAKRACTSPRSSRSSARCRCRPYARHTCGRGRPGCTPQASQPVLRLRAARPAGADLRRRGARRHRAAVAVLAAHLAGPGEAARLRGHHGAGLGTARRDAAPAAPGRPARRVRRAAAAQRRAGCAPPTSISCAASSRPAVQYPAEQLKTEIIADGDPRPAVAGARAAAQVTLTSGHGCCTARTAASCRRGRSSAPYEPPVAMVDGPASRLPLSRPAALLRVAADRRRRGRQDSPGPATARLGQDHARHLRPPLARPGRVDEGRCRRGSDRLPCGTPCGTAARQRPDVSAGQRAVSGQTSKYSSNSCGVGRSRTASSS